MKKINKYLIYIISLAFMCIVNVNAETGDSLSEFNLCETNILTVFQILGYVLVIVKILVPLIIIILAVIELTKTIVSGDDKDMKGVFYILLKKIVTGIMIFLIPSILNLVFTLVENMGSTKSKFNVCHVCLLTPNSDECNSNINKIDSNT